MRATKKFKKKWLHAQYGIGNSHTNCVLHVLQEVGAKGKMFVQDPLTLPYCTFMYDPICKRMTVHTCWT